MSEPQQNAVLAELDSILKSPPFRGSRRCCRLLEYSVQQVLKGSTQEGLKERTIGSEALQRSVDYDTSEDAIVRVTANEVRKRLAQYYQAAANHGDPVIALPPGSYAVTFQWHPAVVHAPVAEPVAAPLRPKWMVPVGVVLVAMVLGMATWLLIRNHGATGPARTAATTPAKADAFWVTVFSPSQKTNIVVSDTAYREIQHFLGRDLTLSEYLAPGYPNSLLPDARPEMRSVVAFLGQQQTTSIGSATLGARLLAFGGRLGAAPVVRYAHHINAREFHTDNFLLLSSRLSIPWVELFEPSMNFPMATDTAKHRYYLRNRAPRPGEAAEYRESDNQEETYADVAVLPNLGGSGTVVVFNGIDMVAVEAAGQFAMSGALAARMAASGSRYGETLIRARDIGGTVANIEVVATREIAK